VVDRSVNPWDLMADADRVFTVSSQFGFEALMAGKEVHCFGAPFYAGWGLTHDRVALPRRTRRATLQDVFAAAYLRYSHYFDAWTRKPIGIEAAIDQLGFLRDRFLGNTTPVVFHRMPRWKQKPLGRLLEGPCPPPRHARDLGQAIQIARVEGRAIAAWGKQANAIRSRVQAEGLQLVSIEDGFLRSAGLGAAFTPSLSYSFDAKGIYYDPSGVSELEELLQSSKVDEALIARARKVREQIRVHNLSKYNLAGEARLPTMPDGRRRILVIGQVADDEAVRKSLAAPEANVNAMVLHKVRQQSPEAFILYKPHPDVERLGRAGSIADAELNSLCDGVLRDVPISAALDAVDEVAVFTSLAGFEALIRDRKVRVFGQPFYAGWGLTQDMQAMPRRTRRLSLDELIAITLIVYPRYYDPVSDLPCPVEVAVARLLELKARPRGLGASLREAAGRGVILWRRIKGS
jgi:capsular polysaccharide export protein